MSLSGTLLRRTVDEDEDYDPTSDQSRKFSNNVEEYGLTDDLPGDEDGSGYDGYDDRGEGKYGRTATQSRRSWKTALAICCCVGILTILGVVLYLVLGRNGDDQAPAQRGSSPTVLPAPTLSPISPSPTAATISPTLAPLPEEVIVEPVADTYLYLGASQAELGPFGQESFVLVQNGVDQSPSIGLLQFDISGIPDAERIEGFPATATLFIHVVDSEILTDVVTIDTMRFLSISVDIEGLPSFQDADALKRLSAVPGPSFDVTPGAEGLSVDITDLIFDQPPFTRARRLATQRDQIFIGFMIQPNAMEEEAISVLFSSSEGIFSPTLEVRIKLPGTDDSTSTNSTSNAPSSSLGPSDSPAPSPSPSISANPVDWSYFCNICGDGNNVTNPEGPLEVPSIGEVTCEGLQSIGHWGGISMENCDLIVPFVKTMCCGERFVCSLCSDGSEITNPDAEVEEGSTCASLVELAAAGLIAEVDCPVVQTTIEKTCCDTNV